MERRTQQDHRHWTPENRKTSRALRVGAACDPSRVERMLRRGILV